MELFPVRSGIAWFWFWGWAIPATGAGYLAYHMPDWGFWHLEGWDTRTSIQFSELVGLFVFAGFMHFTDVPTKAAGFVYYHGQHEKTKYDLGEGPLRGLLTVQSIRSALTFGVLLALLVQREKLLGNVPIDVKTARVTPHIMFFVLAVAGLSGSVLATLAAIQSYDYALRFKWGESKEPTKVEFVQKAHRFGVFGFYCLMWSLAVAANLAGPFAGLLATSAVFIVMWYYYYFKPLDKRAKKVTDTLDPKVKLTPIPGSTLKTHFGKKEHEVVTFAEQWEPTREGLVVLGALLPHAQKTDVDATIAIGDQIVGKR